MQSQRRVQIGIGIGKEPSVSPSELPQARYFNVANFNVVKVEDESFDRISSRSTDGLKTEH